ncbi:MAG: hypothetical protein J0L97_01095 [Alphaproteobacteria bacterium]|nr:hypothetical protein [Alphaproteobacteria bacterium]
MKKRIPITFPTFESIWNFDPYFLKRLQTRLKESASKKLNEKVELWAETGLGELSLSIATKSQIIPLVVRRLEDDWKDLEAHFLKKESKVASLEDKTAYRDPDLSLEAIIKIITDFDSVIFESKSLIDYIIRFLCVFYKEILDTPLNKKEAFELVGSLFDSPQGEPFSDDTFFTDETGWENPLWTQILKELRDEFIHEKATWLELFYDSTASKKFQPCFLRSQDRNEEVVTIDDINAVMNGLSQLSQRIETHLKEKIAEFEVGN